MRDVEPAQGYEPTEATRLFEAAMDDDFNTPEALAALQSLATQINRAKDETRTTEAKGLAAELKRLGGVLGVLQRPAEDFLRQGKKAVASPAPGQATQEGGPPSVEITDGEIERLKEERIQARRERNFKRSDEIRAQLTEKGVILEDKPDGTTSWRRA
jgi:cysteinyl-tRNA synthetase